MANITWDKKDFVNKSRKLNGRVENKILGAVTAVGDEVLRLSQFEVPHDTGLLQNSGHVENDGNDGAIVGYNKVYAARLHEHPEYKFQGGRKGKYLEDPIKNNIDVFKNFFTKVMAEAFK